MKISKKVREEAAVICAIAASNSDLHDAYGVVQRELGGRRHNSAERLAINAWSKVFSAAADVSAPLVDAEAEALLRTGWCPGDEL